jgi:S-DNA-T family DNA segregation ATPase FtsK/SpoIIIE
MNRDELLGRVAATYLADQLEEDGRATDSGTARFIIDCLSADQTAAIARGVLADPDLASRVELKLPRTFVAHYGLPEHVLTDERATHHRNAACAMPALVLANTGDDERQSLADLTPIGAGGLVARSDLWVREAAKDLPLSTNHRKWWERALAALQDLRFVSLDKFGDYVLRVQALVASEGLPIVDALGAALPALSLPKDSKYFTAIPERFLTHGSKWKDLFQKASSKRACYLRKQTPTGMVLTEDELRTSFERVRASIPEHAHAAVESFIESAGGWTPESAILAECEWEDVKPLFDGLRREKYNLGKETTAFYDERDPSLLGDGEREYLRRLSSRRATEGEFDDDKKFFADHRDELREDRKLKSAWDRFVLGAPREVRDFISGLIECLEMLPWDSPATSRKLTIACERRFKKDLRELNVAAGVFFATRYRGLRNLFGRRTSWDVGDLFDFPSLVEQWQAQLRRIPLNVSEAKAALQLKFTVELQFKTPTGGEESEQRQFVWRFDPNWIQCELASDWERLVSSPLRLCRVDREPAAAGASTPSIDLSNVRSLMAAFGQDRGSLVSVHKADSDLAIVWKRNLEEALRLELVTPAGKQELLTAFESFGAEYHAAIKGFFEEGVASEAIQLQLASYSKLLELICATAKGDRNRLLLLRPILQLGVAAVQGNPPAVIVAPWHPLRMAAIKRKATRAGELVRNLLEATTISFGDSRLFFREVREELGHLHYPEVAVGWNSDKAELLSTADSVGDYSLHESPVARHGGRDDTSENPSEGSARVVELVRRYLALHPHERANLSVVLYNCDSSRLPLAVVEKLAELNEDEEDARCQVVLRHRDAKQLRALYEQIVEASQGNGDAFVASESTRDFMARLRIGIMADQAPPPDPREGCPMDMVFSQDVIARHARLEWYRVGARPAEAQSLNPAQWSRRRPVAAGDMKSVVYLTCPVQHGHGWAYLSAVATFFKGDWDGNVSERWLPARELDFQDPSIARIIEETHNLGTWVVNYDELLDRRQLAEQQVRVIRYKQAATQGRNLVISSRAPLGLLRSMILGRLRSLQLNLDEGDLSQLSERFIADANDLSGDIVLRAAKRGTSASELLGVVLSRYLVRAQLRQRYAGWYFLDDYADWLGQREEQIADLLCLSPSGDLDAEPRLAVVVTEAKYVEGAGLAGKRRESRKQLQDTLRRVSGAVVTRSARLDRAVWRARLSDLLVDGVRYPAGANLDLPEWRRVIREERCAVDVRGYSHVFVSGPADADQESECIRLGETDDADYRAYQEVFSRAHVRQIVQSYHRGEDPSAIRQTAVGDCWGTDHGDGSFKGSPPPQNGPDGVDPTSAREEARENQPVAVLPIAAGDGLDSERDVGASTLVTRLDQPHATPEDEANIHEAKRWSYPAIGAWLATASPESEDREQALTWLAEVESATRGALQQFQLRSKLVQSTLTPNAALLKFQGSANLTVDQVLRRRSEFLTTYRLNLVGVQPEPGVVALSIARPQRELVSLKRVWRRWQPAVSGGNRSLVIGVQENDGGLLVLAPGSEHAPHTLIAGSTGSGKSVLMQNIILGIAATNLPSEARITLIDPKQGVDYFAFESLPHLDSGIIDSQDVALTRLQALVVEMDLRYVRLRQARASNLAAYNESVPASERMPVLWLIHDEFAEWMLDEDYKEQVSSVVARLGVKARAAGIHLVFAAQRPDANVMPMQLRANLGNRLILRVDSEGTSEISLGEKGAERLLGRGHLLAKLEGSANLTYAQVPFIAAAEIEEIVRAIR